MKKAMITAAVCAVILLIGSLLLLPVHGEEEIYNNVVRLHVLANSDSARDQELKLSVRDAILEESATWFEGCTSQQDAMRILEGKTGELEDIAKRTLVAQGCNDPVTVVLGREEYPRRSYDSVCFPKGTYTSLRVCIGEAEGQNWWCCMFPPLCLGSGVSQDTAEDAFISVGLTSDQYKVITETDKPVYKVRFKLLELLQEWFE